MARQRSFSDTEVVDQAARVFVAHGFNGTSVNMLAESTGLGKQSLYNAFGDKQALYLKAVDCAVQKFARIASAMHDAPDGASALKRFFDALIADCADPDPARHACIVSAGLLESVDDPAIRMTLQQKWRSSHELLRAAVERGQRDGSIKNRSPSAVLADVLMSLMSGLRVSARVDPSPERLQQAVAQAMMLLEVS
jgi:TetR/AcrR family transcriptional regulator, transcriptional repressor for nem operon